MMKLPGSRMSDTEQLSRQSRLSSRSSLQAVLPSFSGPGATNCSFAALGHISSLGPPVPPSPCRTSPRVSRWRSTCPTCAPCVGMTPWASDLWVACVAMFRVSRVFVCVSDLAWLTHEVRPTTCKRQLPLSQLGSDIRTNNLQSGLLLYGRPLRPNANIRTYNLQRVGCPFRSLKQSTCAPGQCLGRFVEGCCFAFAGVVSRPPIWGLLAVLVVRPCTVRLAAMPPAVLFP